MRHLLNAWNEIAPVLSSQPPMLFLDYDGTLTPIVRHPDLAKLTLAHRKLLKSLLRVPDLKVVIVSGRSLEDLKKKIKVKGLTLVGNHGFEYEGPKIHFVDPQAQALTKQLKKLARHLVQVMKPFPGVFVENKTLTLSVHYRQLAPDKINQAKKVFLKILYPYLHYSRVVLRKGKKVWEIRPPTLWNKGRMVMWLWVRWMAHIGVDVFPIYIGDDKTDEDAFKAMQGRGLGIKVTEEEDGLSHADYYLRSPEEVFDFLSRLKNLKEEETYAHVGISKVA